MFNGFLLLKVMMLIG